MFDFTKLFFIGNFYVPGQEKNKDKKIDKSPFPESLSPIQWPLAEFGDPASFHSCTTETLHALFLCAPCMCLLSLI